MVRGRKGGRWEKRPGEKWQKWVLVHPVLPGGQSRATGSKVLVHFHHCLFADASGERRKEVWGADHHPPSPITSSTWRREEGEVFLKGKAYIGLGERGDASIADGKLGVLSLRDPNAF